MTTEPLAISPRRFPAEPRPRRSPMTRSRTSRFARTAGRHRQRRGDETPCSGRPLRLLLFTASIPNPRSTNAPPGSSRSSSPSSPRIRPSRHLPADRRVEAEPYMDMPGTDTPRPSDRHVADSGSDPRPSVEPSRSTGVPHPRTSYPSSAPRTRSSRAGDLGGVAPSDRSGGGGAHAGRVGRKYEEHRRRVGRYIGPGACR